MCPSRRRESRTNQLDLLTVSQALEVINVQLALEARERVLSKPRGQNRFDEPFPIMNKKTSSVYHAEWRQHSMVSKSAWASSPVPVSGTLTWLPRSNIWKQIVGEECQHQYSANTRPYSRITLYIQVTHRRDHLCSTRRGRSVSALGREDC